MKNHAVNKFCHLVDSNDREKKEIFNIDRITLLKNCYIPHEVLLNLTLDVNLKFDKEVKIIRGTFEVYDGIITISPADPDFPINSDDLKSYSTFTTVGKFVVNSTRRKLTNRELIYFDSDFEVLDPIDPYIRSNGLLVLHNSKIEFYYSDPYYDCDAIRYTSNKN